VQLLILKQCMCIYVCSIYAIGDCIEGPMLAHKAEDEGRFLLLIIHVLHGM